MTTRYIGITELQKNFKTFARRRTTKERLVLRSKDGLCFELRPIREKIIQPKKQIYKKEFLEGLKKAIADTDAGGRVYTTEQVRKRLGL